MRRRLLQVAVCLVAALALAPSAAAGWTMTVGAAEDANKSSDPLLTMRKMTLARLAGFDALRLTVLWSRGEQGPSEQDRLALENAAAAGALNGIRLYVSVYPAGSRQTPLTPHDRRDFISFTTALARDNPTIQNWIIGNEPNLNRFWLPQFTANGADAAAPAYEGLLAEAYDALKAISPDLRVIGGAVSPRGEDDPRSKRQTHSPTQFIPNLGVAYRRSGRTKPIMDAFAFHPYPQSSRVSPAIRHPNPKSKTIGLADYDRLVTLLARAFDGTTQTGTGLPIVYDEFGVQTRIPAAKRRLYVNRSAPAAGDAVQERVQATYYKQALKLSYCQPTVEALLIFHVTDETDLDRWQSGLFYPDDTPKSSFRPVRNAVRAARLGSITRCNASFHPVGPQRHRAHTPGATSRSPAPTADQVAHGTNTLPARDHAASTRPTPHDTEAVPVGG